MTPLRNACSALAINTRSLPRMQQISLVCAMRFPLGAFLKAKVKANVRPLNGVISFAQFSLLCEVFSLGAAQSWPGESNLCRKTRSFTQKLAARDFLVLHPYGFNPDTFRNKSAC